MKLKFTCPKCGKHELGSVEQVIMTYPVTDIDSESKCIEFDSDNPTAGDSYTLCFQCMNCGFELKHDDYNASIIEQEDLVKWVKKFCPQE